MAKIKMQFIIILSICFLSCCSPKPVIETKYVYKPVYVEVPIIEKPQIKPIPRPQLAVHNIKSASSPATVAEAYYNSLQQMIKYSLLLEKALSPFYEEYNNARTVTK